VFMPEQIVLRAKHQEKRVVVGNRQACTLCALYVIKKTYITYKRFFKYIYVHILYTRCGVMIM
jgi:hypothetical protein